jgi:hypothetical protein
LFTSYSHGLYGNEYHIDFKKALWMYRKQKCPGLVRELHPLIVEVNKKKFKKWFVQNHNRFLQNKKELARLETEFNTGWEEPRWEEPIWDGGRDD